MLARARVAITLVCAGSSVPGYQRSGLRGCVRSECLEEPEAVHTSSSWVHPWVHQLAIASYPETPDV